MKLIILIVFIKLMKYVTSQSEYESESEDNWMPQFPPPVMHTNSACRSFKTTIETRTELIQGGFYHQYNNPYNQRNEEYYETVSCKMIEGNLLLSGLCTKCRILEVSESNISKIQTNAFIDIKTIEEIYLAKNRIERIETGAFLGLLQLKTLNLEMNNISKIIRGSFNSLVVLKSLNLSRNVINEIETEAFHGSTSIQILDLSYNNLRIIPEGLLEPFKYLWVLNISNNFLETIGSNLCHGHGYLTYLILNNNNLSEIDCIDTQFQLSELSLSNNFIQDLNVSYIPRSLKKFWFSKNNILELDEHTFDGENSLNSIDISGNELTNIPFGIFKDLKALATLDMSGNNISDFDPDFFVDLKILTTLNISGNNLSTLRESTFRGMISLNTLDLSKNKIRYIPLGILKMFVNLQILIISGNQIENLETGVFNDLHQLTFLDISSNNIESIESHIFLPLKALTSLNLSNNKLSEFNVSELLHSCHDLKLLDINGNSFSCKYLAHIFSNERSSHFHLKHGSTKFSENINGIKCTESETSVPKSPANGKNNMMDLNIVKFFDGDFRKTAFFKYFDNVDRFYKRVDSPDSNKKIISLLETLQNKFSQNTTHPVSSGKQEFLNLDNSTFTKLMDKLSIFVENVTKKDNVDSNMNSFQSTLQSEMEKLIKFENSSNQLFMQEFSKVLDKLESEQITNVEFSKLYAPRSEDEEKYSDDIKKESISNIMELTSETRDLVSVMGQIKFFIVLGVLILIIVCSVRLYYHFKTYYSKYFKNKTHNQETPVLIPLNQ